MAIIVFTYMHTYVHTCALECERELGTKEPL